MTRAASMRSLLLGIFQSRVLSASVPMQNDGIRSWKKPLKWSGAKTITSSARQRAAQCGSRAA